MKKNWIYQKFLILVWNFRRQFPLTLVKFLKIALGRFAPSGNFQKFPSGSGKFIRKFPPEIRNFYKKFWFLRGNFHPDPRSLEGILKIPEGTACCPRGFSKSPNRRWGSGWKFTIINQNFVYIFLCPTQCFACKTTYTGKLTLDVTCTLYSAI